MVSDRRFSTSPWAKCWVIKQLFKPSLMEGIGGGHHGKMTQHELITQFINWLKSRWNADVSAAASCTSWHQTNSCLAWPHTCSYQHMCSHTHTGTVQTHSAYLDFFFISLSLFLSLVSTRMSLWLVQSKANSWSGLRGACRTFRLTHGECCSMLNTTRVFFSACFQQMDESFF